MSKVEQTIIDRLKTTEFPLDAHQLQVGTAPATRRTLARMTQRGLVQRTLGSFNEYRYSLQQHAENA